MTVKLPTGKTLKRISSRYGFANGIHHHYSNIKLEPKFSFTYFSSLVKQSNASGFPTVGVKTTDDLLALLKTVIFDPAFDAKIVDQAPGIDNVKASANNFYVDVTQKEVEDFYAAKSDAQDKTPISYGLNSQLVKKDGKLTERVWKVGGMYGPLLKKIVYWLEKGITVAENAEQKAALEKLVAYYRSGDLKTWDEYNIAWVKDVNSRLDVANGFIEVYQDAISKRASYESVVSMKDMEATRRIEAIAHEAQWFEDHSPIQDSHKSRM